MNVILLADIHIRVDELPVEASWNYQRLMLLATEVNKQECDELWILGDLFDRANATMADLISASNFIKAISVPIKYLNGNHCRINKDVYSLHMLKDVLGISPLDALMEVEGVTLACIGHESIHKIKDLPPRDLLLSHFRWSHDVFGKGELSKKLEKYLTSTFGITILGDIHYPYEPEDNVTYISSPYSINFSSRQDFGMMLLTFDAAAVTHSRIPLDLPCKITTKLNLSLVNGYITSTDSKHLYRVVVYIRHNELEKFKKLKAPDNVELIPQFKEDDFEKIKSEKIEVGGNIKEVLLDSLELPTRKDKDYISAILKEK